MTIRIPLTYRFSKRKVSPGYALVWYTCWWWLVVAVDVAVVVREVVVVAVVAVGTVVAMGSGWWLVNYLSKTWLELGLICLYREDHRWNVIEVGIGAREESGF